MTDSPTSTPRRVSGRTVALVVIAVGVSGAVLGQLGRYVLGPAPWRMTLTPSPPPSGTPTALIALVPHDAAADRLSGTPTLGILAITTRDAAVQPYASPTGATATPWPAITLPPPVATARTLERDGEPAAAEATVRALAAGTGPDAVWGAIEMARMLARSNDNAGALAAIEPAMAGGGPDLLPPPGRLILAEALEAEGRAEESLAAYDSYVRAVPAMAGVVGLQRGQLLFVLGRYEEALADFRAAKTTASGDGRGLAALREGNALLRLNQAREAVESYRSAYAAAANPAARAQALAGEIGAHSELGDGASANALRRQLVNDHFDQPIAAAALQRLKEAGETVDTLGEVKVLAGQGDHAAAVATLEAPRTAQQSRPANWDIQLAQSYVDLDRSAEALAVLDALVPGLPSDETSFPAADLRADILADMDRSTEALAAYEDIARRWPNHAHDAHMARAAVLRQEGDWAGAAAAYDAAAATAWQAQSTFSAMYRAGIAWWSAGRMDLAERSWRGGAKTWDDPEALTVAYFSDEPIAYWLGRAAHDRGDVAASQRLWTVTAEADPYGYYGWRARERLGLPEEQPAIEPGGDGDAATGDWLARIQAIQIKRPSTTRQGRPPVPWNQVRDSVARGRLLAHVQALLDAGRPRTAASELVNAGGDLSTRAALAWVAARIGATRAALLLADSVVKDRELMLDDIPTTLRRAAPAALLRLAYPDTYGDLIRAAATKHGVPQDLLFAVVREESRFEPGVGSSAGAVGLTQVMPETGQHLAGQLGLADFAVEDLKKPAVALDLGAYFLGRQIADYDGRLAPALAAYNAGPGNAVRWWREAGGDEDLFVEIIDFPETSRYVKNVLASRAMYGRLYPDLR